MKEKKETQLNLAITAEMTATLAEIKKWHHLERAQIARGLLEAACKFYDQHKWFGFPIELEFDASVVPARIRGRVPRQSYPNDPNMLNDPTPTGKIRQFPLETGEILGHDATAKKGTGRK